MNCRSKRAFLLTGLAIVLSMVCVATPVRAERLQSFQSRYYEIITNIDRIEARKIASHMDDVHEEYTRRLASFNRRAADRARLYVFESQDAYLEYLREQGFNAENTGGLFFYRGGESGLATWVEGQSETRMFHVLQHEGFHQFAHHHIGPRLSIWINEGIAEYFGQAILVRGQFELGVVPEARLRRIQGAIRDGEAFPFQELLDMTPEQWSDRVTSGDPRAGLLYDQSWAMVHFLIHGDDGRYVEAFESYLHLIADGVEQSQAFNRAFGSDDPEPFEAAWRRHMEQVQPDPLSTAAERLDFLAVGLLELEKRGRKVQTFEELAEELRKWRFRLIRTEHNIEREFSALDPEIFQMPVNERGRPTTIELVSQGRRSINNALGESLPPEIHLTGLRTSIRVQWRWNDQGQPEYQVVFR